MTHAIRLRRAFVATLILTAIITTFPGAPASAMRTQDNKAHISPVPVCPIPWQRGPRYVQRLIGCVAHFYGVGARTALAIAYRESKFHPHAYNARTCAQGVFQHLCQQPRADTSGRRLVPVQCAGQHLRHDEDIGSTAVAWAHHDGTT
jgi:hypothetical protein